MCEACTNTARTTARDRRRKLWELDTRLHCSVVGTCLTLGDLRRIERRLNIEPSKTLTEFTIHGNFVVWAGQSGPAARQMHKLLDRRYATSIRRFNAVGGTDEVEALWEASLKDGDIPGPYWALLTHADATDPVKMRAFGHVHMLSHLVGAANRADVRRLMAIEEERDALAEAVAAAKQRLAERERDMVRVLDAHAAEVRDLTGRLSIIQSLEQHVQQAGERLRMFETGEAYQAVAADLDRARRDLATAERQLQASRDQIATLADDNAALTHARQRIEEMVNAVASECEAMERMVREHLAPPPPDEVDSPFRRAPRSICAVGGSSTSAAEAVPSRICAPWSSAAAENFCIMTGDSPSRPAASTDFSAGATPSSVPSTASVTTHACGRSGTAANARRHSCRCAPAACPPSYRGCAG